MKLPSLIKKPNLFLVLLLVYSLWLISLKNRQTGGMDDFDIFFKAGERLLNGENIYGPPHYYNLKYFYSVFFAGILSLFQWLDINTVKLFWFIINSTLLIRVILLLRVHVLRVNKNDAVVLFFLLLFFGKIVLINYTFNQISILILWTMLEAYHLLKLGKPLMAVFLLCLGINIKIMPIVLVPYFLFMAKKPGQMFVSGIVFLAILLFVPALLIGWDYNNLLIGEWLQTLNPVSKIHVIQTYEYGFTDISSMVTKFFSVEAVYLEPQLHVADLPVATLFIIVNAIRVALLGAAIYLGWKIKEPIVGIHHHIIVVSAFMALIPLCFPHQREYSYLFFMPMLAILMTMINHRKKLVHYLVFVFLAIFGGMLVWVDFAGEQIINVFKHYRLITMGMCAMFLYYIIYVSTCQTKNDTAFRV